jgi:hypothetical protein
MRKMAETFDLAAYMRENGWDPGLYCRLTDATVTAAIAEVLLWATEAAEKGDVQDAKASADLAIRTMRDEEATGHVKKVKREASGG